MSIKHFIAIIVGTFIHMIFIVYEWNKFLNKRRYVLPLLLLFIIGVINYIIIPQEIKTIIFLLFSGLILLISYKITISKMINLLLVQSMISIMSEFLVTIILSFILKENLVEFLSSGMGIFVINMLVGLFIYIIVKVGIGIKLFSFFTKITNKIKINKHIIYTLLLTITLSIITYYSYYQKQINIILIVNTIGIFTYTFITIYIFDVENKASSIRNKYNFNLNILKENEKILNKYKTNNHEHNNNLKTIRRMIENNDPKTINFLNSMIKDNNKKQKEIDNSIIININGLNSLIQTKLMTMKENNIKYNLYVDKKIKNININDDTLLDICKIVGVFLDNAIEEVKNNGTRKINIYIYQDLNLHIEISNEYKNISFQSSKGKNRGFGLKLVEQIISENNQLENIKKITNNIFTQVLIIKDK